MKQHANAFAAVFLLATMPVSAGVATTVDKRIAATATGQVRILNVSGSVTVQGNTGNEVRVTGNLGADVEKLDLVSDRGGIIVKVVLPKISLGKTRTSADIIVSVPQGSRLEVSTVSAEQNIRGVLGDLQVSSVSGDVNSTLLGASAQVKTVSGDVLLNGNRKSGKLTVSTVSGNIRLTNRSGDLDVKTVSGEVYASMDSISALRASTTSGNYSVRGKISRSAVVEFSSVSGNVSLAGGSEAGMDVNLSAFSGKISTCFASQAESASKHSLGKRLAQKLGGGGAAVRVKTLSGDISLCDR